MENQLVETKVLSSIKTSARSSVGSAIIGLIVKITNALLQILTIYLILKSYGTQFNGFIRVSMALAIVGGTSEGALGITTSILMAKPILEKDWIAANEVYSTSKRMYRNKMWEGFIYVTLISFLYPIFIVVLPTITQGSNLIWSISNSMFTGENIYVWQLGIICFFFGFKQTIASSIFGIYENVLSADKKNYLKASISLFSDILVNVFVLILLSLKVGPIGEKVPINPIFSFLPIIVYPFIKGYIVRFYVLKKYSWLRFYSDFNDYKLKRRTFRLFISSICLNILMNFDILIVFVILGTSGLRVSSMLSIYLIIALNIRMIMLTFVTSFRDYFLLVILKEGRLSWNKYLNYEMYTFVIAAFNFIVMAMLTRFIAVGLYGNVLQSDFTSAINIENISNIQLLNQFAEGKALEFIFSNKWFSVLFAASTSLIIIIQGQYVLIDTKSSSKKIIRAANSIAIFYIVSTIAILFTIYRTGNISAENEMWIVNIIIGFYIMKLFFSFVIFCTLWIHIWKFVTYNSSLKGIVPNFLFLFIPTAAVVTFMALGLDKVASVKIDVIKEASKVSVVITQNTVKEFLSVLLLVFFLSFPICLILPLMLKPKIGLSMILSIPIFRAIIKKFKISSKIEKIAEAGFEIDKKESASDKIIQNLYKNIENEKTDKIFSLDEDLNKFQDKYNYKKKPKIYTVTPRKSASSKKKADIKDSFDK